MMLVWLLHFCSLFVSCQVVATPLERLPQGSLAQAFDYLRDFSSLEESNADAYQAALSTIGSNISNRTLSSDSLSVELFTSIYKALPKSVPAAFAEVLNVKIALANLWLAIVDAKFSQKGSQGLSSGVAFLTMQPVDASSGHNNEVFHGVCSNASDHLMRLVQKKPENWLFTLGQALSKCKFFRHALVQDLSKNLIEKLLAALSGQPEQFWNDSAKKQTLSCLATLESMVNDEPLLAKIKDWQERLKEPARKTFFKKPRG